MPANIIFDTKSFLFVLYIILVATAQTLYVASNSNSSSNPNNNNQSINNEQIIYNTKRFDKKRRSVWRSFIEFLETHYEFTLPVLVDALSNGTPVNLLTVRNYIVWAKQAGWVTVRTRRKRPDGTVIVIYRSLIYREKK